MLVYKLTTYILVENNQYAVTIDLYSCSGAQNYMNWFVKIGINGLMVRGLK